MRFGDVSALKQAEMQVSEGALHALVGEYGAGKSTLMSIVFDEFKNAPALASTITLLIVNMGTKGLC